MEVYLSVPEAASLLGLTDRGVRKRVARGLLVAQAEPGRFGRGGKQYRIPLSSLDISFQLRFYSTHPELEMPPEVRAALEASGAVAGPADVSEAARELVKVLDSRGDGPLEQALNRAEVVKEALRLQRKERREYIERVSREAGISPRTVYRWLSEYEAEGLVAMVDEPKKREPQGYGVKSLPCQEAVDFIHGLYLQPHRPKGSTVYQAYLRAAEAKGWPVCSRATFYRILKSLPPTYVEYGRAGEKRWKLTMMPKGKRTRKGLLRNEWWVLDHHQLDFWVTYRGRPIRPWLTAIEDQASMCIVGVAFSARPSSDSIAAALAAAIFPKEGLPFSGLPGTAYMDNGKDYRSRRISGAKRKSRAVPLSPALRSVFDLLRVEVRHCREYAAYAKTVERLFGLVTEFSREQVSYWGHDPEHRPEHVTMAWVRKLNDEGKLPRFEDLPAMWQEWYSRTWLNHPSRALGGKTPLQVYEETPAYRSDMPDQNVAFLLFGKGETATVTPQGIQKFGYDFWFWSDELYEYVGKKVTVRYDPNRVGELYVFDGTKFVCKVENRELLRMGATEEAVEAWCREQAAARKRVREEVTRKRKTVLDVVSEVSSSGPPVVTIPLAKVPAGKVATMTGLEKAARARADRASGQAPAPARDLADEYLMSLADQALARMAKGGA